MNTKAKKDKYTTANGYAYLTKRLLVSKATAAIKLAADEAMKIMGYVVVAENGWIIRKNADGTIERIEEIPKTNRNGELVLD